MNKDTNQVESPYLDMFRGANIEVGHNNPEELEAEVLKVAQVTAKSMSTYSMGPYSP